MIKKLDVKKQIFVVRSTEQILDRIIFPELLNSNNALYRSEKLDTINLSFRELFGLVIISYTALFFSGKRVMPASDPDGRDGLLTYVDGKESVGIAFEQVFIPKFENGKLLDLIISAIKKKSQKGGKQYAQGYGLIIFSDKNGRVKLSVLKNNIVQNPFESIWWISKIEKTKYRYMVSLLKSNAGDPLGEYCVDFDIVSKRITVGRVYFQSNI